MSGLTSLCVMVEIETIPLIPLNRDVIKRVVRTYESRERADEDLDLLTNAAPGVNYRIDDVDHIER